MSSRDDDTIPSTRPPIVPIPQPETLPRIGEFEILGKLGEGSFGLVYLARQTSLGREVALKITHPDADEGVGSGLSTMPHADPMSRHEGQLLAGLEHDHIVKVFSEFHDAETGSRGLCLQYVPGANLGAVIKHMFTGGRPESGADILKAVDAASRGGVGFDPAALRDREALAGDDFTQAVCRLGARLAEALAFAHARGILHCDIKPANILVTPYGRPMLADFNVAFDQSRCRTADGGIGGTIAYMAPEQRVAVFTGDGTKVDERCDIYSLGMVLHELATGKRAAADGDGSVPTPTLDGVPRELAAVIRRCLDPDPRQRYQSASELALSLDGAWHLLAARRSLPPAGRVGRWVTAHPALALALAALIPHLVASAVSIAYNAVEIDLNEAQERAFGFLVLGYNLVAYPICVGTIVCLLRRIHRQLVNLPHAPGSAADELRGHVIRLGWWVVAVGALGWLPGAIVFPLVIDLAAGAVGWLIYAHYAVSFTLAGLIGVVFSFLGTEYVVFRALLPHLGNPDTHTPRGVWMQVRPLTIPFGSLLVVACAVPLTGAVLLIALADERMTLGFRLLVAGLIGLGVVGVGVAEQLTRKLRSLCGVWQREAGG